MSKNKLFVLVIVLLLALVTITGATWALTISGQQPGDVLFVNSTNAIDVLHKGTQGQVLTMNNNLPAWSNSSGGSSGTSINIADNIIYKDATGFHALRTFDNVVTHSNIDGALLINEFLTSLRLYHSPSNPNMYDPITNPNGFKEGRRIVSTCAEIVSPYQIIIPPNQDLYLDFGISVILYTGLGNYCMSIDSSETSTFILPLLACYNGSSTPDAIGQLYIYPHTQGPDDITQFFQNKLSIRSMVMDGYGLILDGTSGMISNNDILISELNLDTTVGHTGIYILDVPITSLVHSNRIEVTTVNGCNKIMEIAPTNEVRDNQFDISVLNQFGIITTAPIIDGSNGLNEIYTLPTSSASFVGTGSYTLPNNVWTQMTNLTVKKWDRLNEFADSSFTARYSGYYSVSFQGWLTTPSMGGTRGVKVMNTTTGEVVADYEGLSSGNTQTLMTASNGAGFYLNRGDVLKCFVYQNCGSDGTFNGSLTRFYITKIR